MESSMFRATVYLANDKGQVSVESGDRREIEKLVRDFVGIQVYTESTPDQPVIDEPAKLPDGIIGVFNSKTNENTIMFNPDRMECQVVYNDEWGRISILLADGVLRDSAGHSKPIGKKITIGFPDMEQQSNETVRELFKEGAAYLITITKSES